MTLFIGNISYNITEKDIADLFGKYGKCKINFKRYYAFAAFEDKKDAEKAKEELNSKKLGSKEINIEWCRSKPHGRDKEFMERDNSRDEKDSRDSERDRDEYHPNEFKGKCYICNKYGHYARDCRESRRRYTNSRKSYGQYSRYRRSRSRSRSRNNYYSYRRRSWRNEIDRSRSSSRNNRRYHGRSRRRDDESWGNNSFGSRSNSWKRSKSRNREKNGDRDDNGRDRGRSKRDDRSRREDRSRDRNEDRERDWDKDRNEDRYNNKSNNMSRSNSLNKEKYNNKKEKSNGGNENSEESWGIKKKKAEDLKE